ncbi:MAG: hypothetical protein ACRELY_29330 [Polyangiaceae bacterium]
MTNAPIAEWIAELTSTVSSRLVEVESANALEDAELAARRRREVLRAFELSIPTVYRWARFDHPGFRLVGPNPKLPTRPPTAKRVVFLGPAGAGKTTLAVAMLRSLLEELIASRALVGEDNVETLARHCRFAAAHRLGVARLAAHADPAEIQSAMRAPVLLLDDLGDDAHIGSNPIPNIIAERHAEDRVTWITTGLSPDEIAARYGGGTARRVLDGAECIRLEREAS